MPRAKRKRTTKSVESLRHQDASRKNIPTAEYQAVMAEDDRNPIRVAYERRNPDLDPQLVWRGKDEQNWSDLVVQAPPLFIQEKVHPKVLIDDLRQRTRETEAEQGNGNGTQADLFAGLQRAAGRGRADGVLPARRQLVEPDDSRGQPAGDGVAGGTGGAARQGAVHLHRPALRHQVQLQLPVVNDQPGCEGRERRAHHARTGAGEGVPGYLAGRDSFVYVLSAGSADGGAGSVDGERVGLRADRR